MTQVTKALKDIWEADEAHIPSYSENRFPTSFAGIYSFFKICFYLLYILILMSRKFCS